MSLPGKYIYCFIKEKDGINICSSSFANIISPVYTLPFNEISAVVSNTDIFEYDPTRKNVQNHQRVITKVMEKYTVIPVAFGTVGNNKKSIENIIKDNYEQLLEQLNLLENKSEVGLKVTWDINYFNQDIETKEIKELKAKVAGKEEDEVLLDKIQLGRLVQQAIEDRKEEYINQIYNPLSKLAVMSKRKDEVPIKTVFNAYFLVDNAASESFDQEVERIYKAFDHKLVFNYTGPWPPYNFTNLRINTALETED